MTMLPVRPISPPYQSSLLVHSLNRFNPILFNTESIPKETVPVLLRFRDYLSIPPLHTHKYFHEALLIILDVAHLFLQFPLSSRSLPLCAFATATPLARRY